MITITAVGEPSEEDFAILKCGLNGFNDGITGPLYRETVSAFVKDADGQTQGGILGEIKWGWLYVQGLWISECLRSTGIGAQLLKRLEDDAVAKGITHFRLETTSFQALAFYHKYGYQVFAELADMPPGHTSYFLKKVANA